MNMIGVIPARMGSTRFPGKPLAEILGKPMIYHVYWRSKKARCLNEVYIATCDNVIEEYCMENNINVVMTKDTHERASDRAAEAMLKIEEKSGIKTDVLVMIQGDEPMVSPEMIDQALKPLIDNSQIHVVNLMADLKSRQECDDPNEVKVVVDRKNWALYFSREPIPTCKKGIHNVSYYKQVCIIPFRRDFLLKFNSLPQTPLEIAESIDMLRLLEHGYKVKMVYSPHETYSVDTKEDLIRVNKLMSRDPLIAQYVL